MSNKLKSEISIEIVYMKIYYKKIKYNNKYKYINKHINLYNSIKIKEIIDK